MQVTPVPIEDLWPRFDALWTLIPASGDVPGAFSRLLLRYDEPHRGHHGLLHIRELLALVDWCVEQQQVTTQRARSALETAVWYHDAIYNPASGTNEFDSAQLMYSDMSAEETFLDRAAMIIESSKIGEKHEKPAEQLFHDIDYWILGSPPERYEVYARGIAHEYLPLTDPETYVRKRKAFLESQLPAASIYYDKRFRNALDAQSKENIRWELDRLSDPAYVSTLGKA